MGRPFRAIFRQMRHLSSRLGWSFLTWLVLRPFCPVVRFSVPSSAPGPGGDLLTGAKLQVMEGACPFALSRSLGGREQSPALKTPPLQPLTREPIGRTVSGVIESSGAEFALWRQRKLRDVDGETDTHTGETYTERQREKAKTQHFLYLLVTITKNV